MQGLLVIPFTFGERHVTTFFLGSCRRTVTPLVPASTSAPENTKTTAASAIFSRRLYFLLLFLSVGHRGTYLSGPEARGRGRRLEEEEPEDSCDAAAPQPADDPPRDLGVLLYGSQTHLQVEGPLWVQTQKSPGTIMNHISPQKG